jgi:hypothetical protein
MGVIVVMRTLAVLLLLLFAGVVVAVGQLVVIVRMGVPVRLVMPLTRDAATMLMRDVVVIVAVRRRLMGVVWLVALALDGLRCHHLLGPPAS